MQVDSSSRDFFHLLQFYQKQEFLLEIFSLIPGLNQRFKISLPILWGLGWLGAGVGLACTNTPQTASTQAAKDDINISI